MTSQCKTRLLTSNISTRGPNMVRLGKLLRGKLIEQKERINPRLGDSIKINYE